MSSQILQSLLKMVCVRENWIEQYENQMSREKLFIFYNFGWSLRDFSWWLGIV